MIATAIHEVSGRDEKRDIWELHINRTSSIAIFSTLGNRTVHERAVVDGDGCSGIARIVAKNATIRASSNVLVTFVANVRPWFSRMMMWWIT